MICPFCKREAENPVDLLELRKQKLQEQLDLVNERIAQLTKN